MNKNGNNDPRMELLHKILDEASKILIAQLPLLKKISMDVIETVFVPRTIARQLVLLMALDAGMVTLNQVTSLIQSLASNFSSRSRLIRELRAEQQKAGTQEEWFDLAERIDQIQGNDAWRSDPNCALYERDRISARIAEFSHLMRRHDIFELMFVLRGSIARNKFGLLHRGLFSKALAGSKVLIETYHSVVCGALDYVCDAAVSADEDPIPTDARLAFFNETRHSFGRTALLLSGGAALGFYHMGVVKTLMDNSLMPRVIGGASAGSLVCAMIGTRTDEEILHDLLEVRGTDAPGHSGRLALNFFRPMSKQKAAPSSADGAENKRASRGGGFAEVYRNTAGAFHDAKLTLQGLVPIPLRHFSSMVYDVLTGSTRPQDIFMNDTHHFRECVRLNVGNFTFQEAFDRTGRILNIVVTPQNASDPPRLLNYLTAPHIMVWSAAVASSSLPGVFESNRLVVKEADGWERYESGGDGQRFFDGSMESDLPMQQLSEMFNVNHFIISQANPHAVMFASYAQNSSVWTNPFTGFVDSVINFLKDQVRTWLAHLVELVGARRLAPALGTQRDIGVSFFTQEYEGRASDISLIPWLNHRSLFSAMLHIIYNPSEAEFREWILAAQRETWRFLPAIKSHIAEEVTLDRCVQRLRRRLMRESWEKHAATSAEEKMDTRVPSFFNSPSLVHLGGLAVADQPNVGGLHNYKSTSYSSTHLSGPESIPEVDINSGWAGQGLHGNRSSGNLERSASQLSGLFIDDEDHTEQQQPGEVTEMPPKKASFTRSKGSDSSFNKGYMKTTSMAKFYYRNTGEYAEAQRGETIPKTKSDPVMERDCALNPKRGYTRRKSKSHADLPTTSDPDDALPE